MSFLVQLPSTDTDLIMELSQLPGIRRADESYFDGADVVRVFVEVAAASAAIAATAKSAEAATKSAAEIIKTLRSVFRRGVGRHRTDPDGEFVVLWEGKPFVSSDMPKEDVARKLAALSKHYARRR